MASLAPALRKKLEDAVKEARDVAEAGARAALEQLAVGAAEPFAHLTPDDRELRNRLRARARQLGDARDTRTGAHQIDHLVVECAYEHWHRMLFARFLAENGVLMANSEALGIENTPVTLEECQELAADEGATNGWELAGRYASRMLPQIFRPDAPVLAVHLPAERQRRLELILADLAPAMFKASDALGWVYQFWQAKKKDEVNASGVKIGADELPAVTQLFTEPYMVEFLLHNTLGAWWAGKVLSDRPELARAARSEDELRDACALPGWSWTYLRFVQADGRWRPAAGTFDGWPRTTAQVKVLDPCCGSGHFLVAAFEILVRLRAHEEGLDVDQAGEAVLRDNLHGLELDERCTQLAAFALALSTWSAPGGGGYRTLPRVHIACSGLAPRAKADEWESLAGDNPSLQRAMSHLHEFFQDATVLGSLVDPGAVGSTGAQRQLGVSRFEEVHPVLLHALDTELGHEGAAAQELGVTALGVAAAAALLSQRYHLVITNVPYLVRGKQDPVLMRFADRFYADAKADLSTVMMERMVGFLASGASAAVVIPQNWLFLTSYRRLRTKFLGQFQWDVLARLGSGAFQTITGEVVNVALFAFTSTTPSSQHSFFGVDVSACGSIPDKLRALQTDNAESVSQSAQLSHPDARLSFRTIDGTRLLSRFAEASHGQGSFDAARFSAQFWELPAIGGGWVPQQSTVPTSMHFGGCDKVFRWEDGTGELAQLMELKRRDGYSSGKWRAGIQAWGRQGVLVSQMGNLPACLYTGTSFDENATVVIPRDPGHLAAIWCFCSSPEFGALVREVDQSLKVTCKTVVKVPFELEYWKKVATQRYPSGLPIPHSDDPTQWLFGGRVETSISPLHVALARMLGFRWPDQAIDGLDTLLDDDGIMCLPPVRGEAPASDRLVALLEAAFGERWSAKQRDQLLAEAGAMGKGVDWWLQNRYFEQHCQLFQQRPFIWHVWDGIKKDGFGALVNYHKLDRKLLETLTYTYLGDWIRRQQDDGARNVDGASERLDAARRLQQSLELILEGEKPHDIFVRWKSLQMQPIGWEPDLSDGVRLNIRPFLSVPDVDRRGAGILRYKPNINWNKDRGADPKGAPWYELGLEYGENKGARINDHHLSLAEKRAARERSGGRE